MTNTELHNPQMATRRRRSLARFRILTRRAALLVKVEILLAVLAVLSGAATFVALSEDAPSTGIGSGLVTTLLLLDLVLLVSLAGLVARRVVSLWLARRKGSAGSKLHLRLVGLFSLVAAVPPVIMAILSALFLQFGVENWFSSSVRGALNNSLEVAEAYIEEHRNNIELDLVAMANDLNRAGLRADQNKEFLQRLVTEQAILRSLQEAIVFDRSGRVLAKYTFDLDLSANRVPQAIMQRIREGERVVISNPGDDQIRALTRLDNFLDAYLYISRPVDPKVTAYVEAARGAVSTYRQLEQQRSSVQLRTNAIFIVIAFLMLLAAVWIGLWLANRLVTPISRLVSTAERVRQGDLTARAEGPSGPDEIGVLSRTFNRMTRQLEAQRRELVSTNLELDERRRFLEAVLEGVSAGVLGVREDGIIHLPNLSACELLGCRPEDLIDQALATAAPDMAPLLREAGRSRKQSAQAQVGIQRDGQTRMLLVRVTVESQGGKRTGYVVTFDDITEQLRDQRTAAWADVARRIAHEIKNPLTPIQLSAERLRRRFETQVEDPEILATCTDTIIRQVADLRRMVDEFSAFARMPSPVFQATAVNDIIREAAYLQEMADSRIEVVLDLPHTPVDLVCDSRMLSQAVTNLIKNAVESVSARLDERPSPAGRVRVALDETDDAVSITVEDNGLGLPEDVDRLLEPYVTTRAKGTGLGLAIVKKIVEEHAGRLVLRNSEDGGARVAMRFFRARLEEKGAAGQTREASEAAE